MKFSTRTEYGMRVMVQLAKNYNKTSLSLATIAKKEKVSQPYLEQLVAKLKSKKLVSSTKGVKGGYKLTKEPKKIPLFEIIQALEGPIVLFNCLTDNASPICTHRTCLTKKVWLKIQDQIIKVLKTTKLSELI